MTVELDRRELLLGAATGALALGVAGRWPTAAAAGCATPRSFPAGIPIEQADFVNWSRQIRVEDLWTATPRTPDEVVDIVNWAARQRWSVRPRGMMHSFAPWTVPQGGDCRRRAVLVDTTKHLTALSMLPGGVVRAQAGATMDSLLSLLEQHGLGFTNVPAPGDVSVGGVLAIDAHGTAVAARGEERGAGASYGSLSNVVVSLTAVVWSPSRGRYVLKRLARDDRRIGPLLVHLGRAFIVEAELQATEAVPLRCQSFMDISASELFSAPGSGGRTFAGFVEQAGRIETIQFPFTDTPWTKVWTPSPRKPAASRAVSSPYNYPFSDNIPEPVAELARQIIEGQGSATPTFGALQYAASRAGLLATLSFDIWGPPRTTQLYIKPTTLRTTANGYAIVCRRADIQRVVHEFHVFRTALIDRYRARGLYPANMPAEIRVTGLDHPTDIGVRRARTARLSALRPGPPDHEVAVWLDQLTFARTPDSLAFFRELEQWTVSNYSRYASVRPEWSKGFAYSTTATWDDDAFLRRAIPAAHGHHLRTAATALGQMDPHAVFSSPLARRILR